MLESSLASFLPDTKSGDTPFTHLTSTEQPHDSLALAAEVSDGFSGTSSRSPLPSQRTERPALLVSSTSWTSDERFDILLEALQKYEMSACEINKTVGQAKRLPKVLVIVTGKGDEKEKYMSEVMRLERDEDWRWVRLRSLWLEARDYPTLLGTSNKLHLLDDF